MKKKVLNTNFEVYNYLNITNRRLSKLYKYSGYNFLPSNFDITAQTFKERLELNQMQKSNIFPPFSLAEKSGIKNFYKNSIKNIKKIIRAGYYANNFSPEFAQKVEIYFDMRLELTRILLKDFNDQTMDEVALYQEIYNLEPVFAELFEGLYQERADLDQMFSGLEESYKKNYLQKLKTLEKKQTKRVQKSKQIQQELENVSKKAEKSAKNVEKTAQNSKKAVKTNEIKQVKAENKKAKQKVREKE